MRGGPGTSDPLHIAYRLVTIKEILAQAYALKRDRISGSDWLDIRTYDVDANVPPGTTPEQFQTMLQNLLADRFHLSVHWEKKPSLISELSVARDGPKLKTAIAKGPINVALVVGGARVSGKGSIAALTRELENQLDIFMEDKTGLTGTFEFDLRFRYDPDETLTTSDREDHGFLLPLLNIALARLGLDVKNRWVPVDMLRVDHADKIPAWK
jgi:uncharacterized protein (TIGR03435 family)